MVKLIERKQEGKQASEQGRELDLGSHLAAQFQSATAGNLQAQANWQQAEGGGWDWGGEGLSVRNAASAACSC